MASFGFRTIRRHDRPRRAAPDARGDRPLEGRRSRPDAAARRRRAKPRPSTEVYCTKQQDHGLNLALDNKLIALGEEVDRAAQEDASRAPTSQHEPDGRRDALATRSSRSGARTRCRTTRSTSSSRARRARASARSWRRASRSSSRATATTTSARASRAAASSSIRRREATLRGRGQHPDRQRGAVRRDERPRVLPRPLRRAVLRAQQRVRRPSSKASATTAAST